MKIFDELRRMAHHVERSSELLAGIVAGVDNQQKISNDKLSRLIELQAAQLTAQHTEIRDQKRQIELLEEYLKGAVARDQLRFQALLDNQKSHVGFQRAQIEMMTDVLKAAISGEDGRARTMLAGMDADGTSGSAKQPDDLGDRAHGSVDRSRVGS